MTCKKTLCQECATDWDGIYYCSACLGSADRSRSGAPVPGDGSSSSLASAALFAVGPPLLVWGATLLQRGLH
jgi:hypothetical protein